MKKQFKNEATEEIKEIEVENSRTRVVIDNKSKWKVIPKPKYQSRASRRDKVVAKLGNIYDDLGSIKADFDTLIESMSIFSSFSTEKDLNVENDLRMQVGDHISEAQSLVASINIGEIKDLLNELESWMGTMSGTNLENKNTYRILGESCFNLQEAVDSLELIPSIEKVDSIAEAISNLDVAIRDLRSVKFPEMFS